jgi:hypothetical protein
MSREKHGMQESLMQEVLYITFGNMVGSVTKAQAQIASRYSRLLSLSHLLLHRAVPRGFI